MIKIQLCLRYQKIWRRTRRRRRGEEFVSGDSDDVLKNTMRTKRDARVSETLGTALWKEVVRC